jgi:uncharacterized protein
MKRAWGLVFLTWLLLLLPAVAREAIIDEAKILDSRSMEQVQRLADDIQSNFGKDVVVVTVDRVEGTPQQHAEKLFSQQNVNGVLIYVAPNQKQLGILPGRNTAQLFPRTVTGPIRESMLSRFRQNDYGGGIVEGVQRVRGVLANAPTKGAGAAAAPPVAERRSGGGGGFFLGLLGLMPLLFLGLGAFLLFRMFRGARRLRQAYPSDQHYPAGYGHGHGYGQGYGRHPYPVGAGGPMGGGGGFLSGMLGGLGGAMLGNAMYDHFRGGDAGGGMAAGSSDPGWGTSDAGSAGAGDFSDFGGGGGDFGGGGEW